MYYGWVDKMHRSGHVPQIKSKGLKKNNVSSCGRVRAYYLYHGSTTFLLHLILSCNILKLVNYYILINKNGNKSSTYMKANKPSIKTFYIHFIYAFFNIVQFINFFKK